MGNILLPDLFVNSLLEIPLDRLQKRHKKVFILDLDNTITEWNSNELRPEVLAWFKIIGSKGFRACIVSNNGEKRILQVAEKIKVPFIHKARKPGKKAFVKALHLMQVGPDEAVVVGDQIFTDILGGNRAGIYTVLVKPINSREFFGTRISRIFEGIVLNWIKPSQK